MYFLKIFGGMLVLLTGFTAGWLKSRGLYRRRDFLRAVSAFLSSLQTSLRYDCADIFTLVSESAHRQGLDCFACSGGEDFSAVWSKRTDDLPREYHASRADREILKKLGEGLGATDVEGQLKHIELYRRRVEEQLSQAEEDINKKSRLYKSMGIFAGAAVVLMTI